LGNTCQNRNVNNSKTGIKAILEVYLAMRLRLLENLHIPFWLLKDACWAMVWRPLGIAMIVPTLILSLYLSWRCRKNMGDFLPNAAVTFWITANSIWMLDEFYELGIRWICLLFFGAGTLVIGYWLTRYFPVLWKSEQSEK
jgi:hypothetical protein